MVSSAEGLIGEIMLQLAVSLTGLEQDAAKAGSAGTGYSR